MSITTRFALGSGLVIALLAAVTAYEAGTIARLAAMHRGLGEHTLQTTAIALDLLASRDRLEKHLLKFAATRDVAYAAAAAEVAGELGSDLERLQGVRPAGNEIPAVAEVVTVWQRFPLAADSGPEAVEAMMESGEQEILERYGAPLDELRVGLATVVAAAREQAAARVSAASETAVRTRRLAVSALVVSVALAFAVTGVVLRSIHRPLARLVTATEAIAGGRFDHRVPTQGDDELARLAGHFNSMAERLGELDRLKRDFLSNISHEIKTPLVAMAETSQLLLDEVPGPLTAKQRRFLELQQQSNRRMQELIRDLLDLSRLEAGVMEYRFEARDVRPILEEAIAEVEPLARERGVQVHLEMPAVLPAVRGDDRRLLQVVVNLLGNAARVSPPETEVVVTASQVADEEGVWVRITVRDHGPGVADPEKPLVFERFYRSVGNLGHDRGGVGLGLAICREIVTAHAGRLRVEDADGGGAAFVAELAAAADHGAHLPERESST